MDIGKKIRGQHVQFLLLEATICTQYTCNRYVQRWGLNVERFWKLVLFTEDKTIKYENVEVITVKNVFYIYILAGVFT